MKSEGRIGGRRKGETNGCIRNRFVTVLASPISVWEKRSTDARIYIQFRRRTQGLKEGAGAGDAELSPAEGNAGGSGSESSSAVETKLDGDSEESKICRRLQSSQQQFNKLLYTSASETWNPVYLE